MAKKTLVAVIVWPTCLVLLLPLIWIGSGFDYDLKQWLSLLWFPNQAEENGWWLFRIILFGSFLITTYILVAAAIGKMRRG